MKNRTRPRYDRLPTGKFYAKVVETFPGRLYSVSDHCERYGGGGDAVLDATPLCNAHWANVFAYMYRRFGPPTAGNDLYPSFSAFWVLSSTNPNVFVVVAPSASVHLPRFCACGWTPDNPHIAQPTIEHVDIRNAYRTTLLDLLRPVISGHVWLNALGVIDAQQRLGEQLMRPATRGRKDLRIGGNYYLDKVPRLAVPPAESCASRIPQALIGGSEWDTLCELIAARGNGDFAAGRREAIRVLQDSLSKEKTAPPPEPPQ